MLYQVGASNHPEPVYSVVIYRVRDQLEKILSNPVARKMLQSWVQDFIRHRPDKPDCFLTSNTFFNETVMKIFHFHKARAVFFCFFFFKPNSVLYIYWSSLYRLHL